MLYKYPCSRRRAYVVCTYRCTWAGARYLVRVIRDAEKCTRRPAENGIQGSHTKLHSGMRALMTYTLIPPPDWRAGQLSRNPLAAHRRHAEPHFAVTLPALSGAFWRFTTPRRRLALYRREMGSGISRTGEALTLSCLPSILTYLYSPTISKRRGHSVNGGPNQPSFQG